MRAAKIDCSAQPKQRRRRRRGEQIAGSNGHRPSPYACCSTSVLARTTDTPAAGLAPRLSLLSSGPSRHYGQTVSVVGRVLLSLG